MRPLLAAALLPLDLAPGVAAGTPSEAYASALSRLAQPGGDRAEKRWRFARAALAADRPDEALGALTVMARADPDRRLTPAFALAEGEALVRLGHADRALAVLSVASLSGDSEACAWRLRALQRLSAARMAMAQMPCARAALVGRSSEARTPFLHAAADAANVAGKAEAALHWLSFALPGPRTSLLRGEAELAAGGAQRALPHLVAARRAPDPVRTRAEVGLVEARVALGAVSPGEALRLAERLALVWRGDLVERRLALLRWDLSLRAKRPRSSLTAAATLLRHHPSEPRLGGIVDIVAGAFARWLQPASGVPLPVAAGLMWEYRDLMPGGARGDALVRLLAGRLGDEGLYARAADLLEHQLAVRAQDVAQGPLSITAARYRILAGQPDKALAALRRSADAIYPADMTGMRLKLEAIARFQIGEEEAALAMLADTPGGGDLRADLLWRRRDWAALAALPLPRVRNFDAVAEVRVLRRAIALAMTGDREALGALGRGYAAVFRGKPSETAFRALTGGADAGADGIAAALASLPAASPGGDLADLLDLAPPRRRA